MMFPIALAGVMMAIVGVPPWAWFVLAEWSILRSAWLDLRE
jgi:hypothetical protein